MINANELRLPVGRGARLVGLAYLSKAIETSHRLGVAASDPEALHDFRVAVRRLRSWIRAFKHELKDVRRRDLKRLRSIAQSTGDGRDAEVQLEWLAGIALGDDKTAKRGAEWVGEILQARRNRAGEAMVELIGDRFGKLHAVLEEQLGTYTESLHASPTETLAEAIAARALAATHDVHHALDEVHTITDETPSHEARIAVKRLRYLVEPAADHVEGGGALVRELKSIQDMLGALHDRHMMAYELANLMDASASLSARRQMAKALGAFGECLSTTSGRQDLEKPIAGTALIAVAHRLRADLETDFQTVADSLLDGKQRALDEQIEAFTTRLQSEYVP